MPPFSSILYLMDSWNMSFFKYTYIYIYPHLPKAVVWSLKRGCIGTPYHPFNTTWKIQVYKKNQGITILKLYTHSMHVSVWYISLHLPYFTVKNQPNGGKKIPVPWISIGATPPLPFSGCHLCCLWFQRWGDGKTWPKTEKKRNHHFLACLYTCVFLKINGFF